MIINFVRFSAICIAGSALTAISFGQSATATYSALIQQGNAQLKAGSLDSALGAGQSAVKTNPAGWEGYTLEGGALTNLKRYEEAADAFSKAIAQAPESKQAALRELRRQCLQTSASPPPAASAQPTATTQAEIVLWKSIDSSTNSADFQSYLGQYPQGAFAVLARRHLQEIADKEAALEAEKVTARQRHSQILADLREALSMKNTTWRGCDTGGCHTMKASIEVTSVADCEISLRFVESPGDGPETISIPLDDIKAFSPPDSDSRGGYETMIQTLDGQGRIRIQGAAFLNPRISIQNLDFGPDNQEKANRVTRLLNDATLACKP